MLSRIRAALGRLWCPRCRTPGEHAFHEQGEVRRFRNQQLGEAASGRATYLYRGPTASEALRTAPLWRAEAVGLAKGQLAASRDQMGATADAFVTDFSAK
jgi:hypothetical protein